MTDAAPIETLKALSRCLENAQETRHAFSLQPDGRYATQHVVRGSAGAVTFMDVVTGGEAGGVALYDSASIPADGESVRAFEVSANGIHHFRFDPPLSVKSGLVASFSPASGRPRLEDGALFFFGGKAA